MTKVNFFVLYLFIFFLYDIIKRELKPHTLIVVHTQLFYTVDMCSTSLSLSS